MKISQADLHEDGPGCLSYFGLADKHIVPVTFDLCWIKNKEERVSVVEKNTLGLNTETALFKYREQN